MVDDRLGAAMSRLEVEAKEKWIEWTDRIPFIPMPSGWCIKPLPPFNGAMARFQVRRTDGSVKSVYLDVFDRLGYMHEPYWEVYPCYGDARRCGMDDVYGLLGLIAQPTESPNDETETETETETPA